MGTRCFSRYTPNFVLRLAALSSAVKISSASAARSAAERLTPPDVISELENAYIAKVQQATHHDPLVYDKFLKVLN